MALDRQTSERVYRALKADLLTGALAAGRLNINALVLRHGASATPVREALMRLVGEEFVVVPAAGGFAVARPDPAAMAQLYDLSLIMMLAVVARLPQASLWRSISAPMPTDGDDESVIELFVLLADQVSNHSLAASVMGLQDRICQANAITVPGRPSSTRNEAHGALFAAYCARDRNALERAVTQYHRQRQTEIKQSDQ